MSAVDSDGKPLCPSCDQAGRSGYCARGRCYCGHTDCHAAASWIPLPNLAGTPAPETTQPASSSTWDEREGSTWIDRL